ncbi:hypothetical protein IFR23_13820 [Sphingomonas sp. CFBP 13603]|uniref:hypothetical protein n=1 Tax=Sphingomonas sp. CFBP 13603 TaxID=2774040 RepID=UPI001867A73C|nr:hypothetical protein [Sphingomonas sp. CFBP 13603]MBE2993081.1 hypothetical protein [Sphingomonas sp. CFBP 13603]
MMFAVALMFFQAAAVAPPPLESGKVVRSVRESICELRAPSIADDAIGLLALPAPQQKNEMGVLLFVNCSDRKIISLRDPSRSRRHMNEFPYDSRIETKLRHDSKRYEILNFNKRPNNSVGDHTTHSKDTYWTGPCEYTGLELTTAASNDDHSRQTVIFNLNICKNQVLAMLETTKAPALR